MIELLVPTELCKHKRFPNRSQKRATLDITRMHAQEKQREGSRK